MPSYARQAYALDYHKVAPECAIDSASADLGSPFALPSDESFAAALIDAALVHAPECARLPLAAVLINLSIQDLLNAINALDFAVPSI